MPTTNNITLRPRFKMELKEQNETVLNAFNESKKAQSDFIINRVDDHVFIRFPKHKQHFWSPQLHLEINTIDSETSMLHGLFGPNPTVWTMFMFLHFFVAGLFIAFGIWTYSNWTLENPFGLQLGLMLLMVAAWFGLYLAGRFGKHKGKDEMHQLYDFMNITLKTNNID